jgi:uroporphyrinogen-III synthase
MTSVKSMPGPLAGRRILITRAPHQASKLADELCSLGAVPVLVPTVEIVAPSSFAALDAALASISRFDLVVFTSSNAVEAFHQRAGFLGFACVPRRIAVVGPATARALEAAGLHADVMPTTFTAEALGRTLGPEASGRTILLVLAENAPPTLRNALEAADASVVVARAYGNRIPEDSRAAVAELFADPSNYPDAVTFTSASTVTNLLALLDAAGLALPPTVQRASIGPATSQALRELSLPPHLEASEPTIPALAAGLADHFRAMA